MKTWKTKKVKDLANAFLFSKTQAEMVKFLRDLCTLEELDELSSRWQAAQLLSKNIPYREISEKTGLSTTTVTRIAHWLRNGEGGYKAVLKNIKK